MACSCVLCHFTEIFIILFLRFKNCFFQKRVAKDEAEAALKRMLRVELEAQQTDQPLPQITDQGDVQTLPLTGLAGVLDRLRQQGSQQSAPDVDESGDKVERHLKEYFESKLETVSCLKYWEKQELEFESHGVNGAMCRLARKFLTPPPTSTDVERLFSAAGLTASDIRSNMSPATLEKLLFLRENILVCNFNLDWD